MALQFISKDKFSGKDMISNSIIDKAHVLAKNGAKNVKEGAQIAKKVISEQKENLVKDMNEKADRMEEIIQETREKIEEKEEQKRRDAYSKYVYSRITAGDKFGFISDNGWEELKLIKLWPDINYAVSTIRLSTGEAMEIELHQIVIYNDTDKFQDEKETAERLASKGGLITVQEFEEIKNKFEKQQKEIEDKLKLIKGGASFGILDPYEVGRYFPLEYKYTIDEANGLIKAYETGISKTQYVYVTGLHVEGY